MCLFTLIFHRGKTIVVYFEHCSILKKIFFWKKMHLDIRTLSVSVSKSVRDKYDLTLRNTCDKFDSVSIISLGLKNKLTLPNAYILPLGSDVISSEKKDYASLKLLYVGTLNQRRIEDTVIGISLFVKKHPEVSLKYDIVGDGNGHELQLLQSLISEYNLGSYIELHGRIPYDKLRKYFDEANIGISYVPITEYFKYQPPTKTYEYVLSGLYCLATRTFENEQIIKEGVNGYLILDNPVAFADALEYLAKNMTLISEQNVRDSLADYTWKNIVSSYLIPILSGSYDT